MAPQISAPDSTVDSYVSPLLADLLYYLVGNFVLPCYFRRLVVSGQHHLPRNGPVILAPTHRSRWDALIVPYVAGKLVTGRDLRFMVSDDEMLGLQGWVIRNFGGFPVDTTQPAIAALRHGIEILKAGQSLVIFPEGNIFRTQEVQPLKPGLARIAIQAAQARPTPDVQIVPIAIQYSQPFPQWGTSASIQIGQPLQVSRYDLRQVKLASRQLTADLQVALNQLTGNVPQPRPSMASC